MAAYEDDALADRVEREVRLAFGAERVYIPALPDSRREEALRLLRDGMSPDRVAQKVGAHPATVYRWRKTSRRRTHGTGLADHPDWLL